LPENKSFYSFADGLAEAFKLYGRSESKNKVVAIIVQPGERNVADQRWIQFHLNERHHTNAIRRTLRDIADRGHLDPATKILTM